MPETVLSLNEVSVSFPRPRNLGDVLAGRARSEIRAVDGVSLELRPGEVLAIVGESGCGKTTTANLIMGLLAPTSGQVVVHGSDLATLTEGERRRRRKRIQMVFQDPYESLNPRMTVQTIVAEPLEVHGEGLSKKQVLDKVLTALDRAGLRLGSRA